MPVRACGQGTPIYAATWVLFAGSGRRWEGKVAEATAKDGLGN